ncbi:MAG: hypothetical protein HRU19_18175 [Pseudobacteriovorax sp.]|nr:hypothetical protein [Pseudobacteriovorax sp.]
MKPFVSQTQYTREFRGPNHWTLMPLFHELERTAQLKFLRSENPKSSVFDLPPEAQPLFTMASTAQLISGTGCDLALPVGEVLHGPHGLAYFASESMESLLKVLEPRIQKLKSIFLSAEITKRENMRDVADKIWYEVAQLKGMTLCHVPHVRFCDSNSSYAALGKLMYLLLFGSEAYRLNTVMQSQEDLVCQNDAGRLSFKCSNSAMNQRCQHRHVIDLIELWNHLTGLPFVASVLQKSSRCPSITEQSQLIACAELTQAKMQVEPSCYLPDIPPVNVSGQSIDLARLWKDVSYRLKVEDFKSMILFLNLSCNLDKSIDNQSVRLMLLRWQQKEKANQILKV